MPDSCGYAIDFTVGKENDMSKLLLNLLVIAILLLVPYKQALA